MNLKEAYETLRLTSSATPEEVKKQYKKLAKEFHPDRNKSAGAEAKFKEINQANDVIQAGEQIDQSSIHWNPFGNNMPDILNNIFNRNGQSGKVHYANHIELLTNISFKNSVQGCKQQVKYTRKTKCPHCQGNGNKPINNGCQVCKGRGQVTNTAGGSIFIQTCTSCRGKSQTTPCNECHQSGVLNAEMSLDVSIPSYITNGNVLRLQNMGNFGGTVMGLHDQYTDVLLRIDVSPEPGLRLEGKDVVSHLDISLLEALQGCNKEINTIDGSRKINIDSGIKNKEEVILSVGDHNDIKHRVVVNVSYPSDVSKIIDLLIREGKIK